MKVEQLLSVIKADFYTGVPDSQLRALCDYLVGCYGVSKQHIIAANEGNALAIASGYYMSTKKVPVVYMQNSGIGNIVNPVTSLTTTKVYAIPTIFIIGWRGEPGTLDEPQHIFQGELSLDLLNKLDISTYILDKTTRVDEVIIQMEIFRQSLSLGKSVAFLVKKEGLFYDKKIKYTNSFTTKREKIIEKIVEYTKDDIVVSTTGKASRELYEIRERQKKSHKYDFLTVGSMGHSSSIALGIALYKANSRVWCIDGDGAALMHLGSLAIIGTKDPNNLVHVIINNGSHETVGGMPTVALDIQIDNIAKACGYKAIYSVSNYKELEDALSEIEKNNVLTMLEIKCGIGAREDLGRPKTSPIENKTNFMNYLETLD